MKKKRTSLKNNIHVVAAVIENDLDQIFIAKRPDHVHQGGLWEFPGGKVEADESPEYALKRELFEELGIQAQELEPLIKIQHNYPDKSVFLDVWRVTGFDGEPYGKEGQQTCWVHKCDLSHFQFPTANKAIINATTLPRHYLITPEPDFNQRDIFLSHIEKRLQDGIKLIQLRAKNLNSQQLGILYNEVHEICQTHKTQLLINSSIAFAKKLNATGVHLSSTELQSTNHLPEHFFCAASCHTTQEIEKASQLGVNFIVVSPVLKTLSHPEATPLNWKNFETLCHTAAVPVYALGGMKQAHLPHAIACGAQGISAIRSLW